MNTLSNSYEVEAFKRENSISVIIFGLPQTGATEKILSWVNAFAELNPTYMFGFVNYDENKGLGIQSNIRTLPNLDLFIDGTFKKRINYIESYEELTNQLLTV